MASHVDSDNVQTHDLFPCKRNAFQENLSIHEDPPPPPTPPKETKIVISFQTDYVNVNRIQVKADFLFVFGRFSN